MKHENSKGKIFYGMHFYPGVAEYQEPNRDPYRVFLNEDTIRSMDPTFAGRPVFVMHVDEVEQDLNKLREDADGWVVESFFNQADGKHWVKFIVVSDRAEQAIKRGMRLSNCYEPNAFGQGGLWNGVSYAKEITGAEYEHLAIVPNPRYEESVIMTPEQFKKYNEDSIFELKRLANDKNYGKGSGMKIQLFKKSKVDNDLSDMSVVLPKSGREVSLADLIRNADGDTPPPPPPSSSGGSHSLDAGGVASVAKAFGNEGLADPSHKVKLHDGSYCNVADLVEKHKAMSEELEMAKKKKEDSVADDEPITPDEDGDPSHGEVDMSTEDKMNEVEDVKPKDDEKEVEDAKKKKNDLADKKLRDKAKADKLRNAHNAPEEMAHVDLSEDKVARGVSRYGSGR